jgi:dolichyl-phosphooligosaccharide-protein glycotransferase
MPERLARLGRWWPLAGVVVAAALTRTVFLAGAVFTGDGVNYQDSDAWYHMRLIDNLARNYPHRASVDPYLGAEAPPVAVPLLFDVVVAGLAWLIGLGDPSTRTVEVVAALVPPVLGALTAVPVFLIGARLFDRRAGLLAAALLAIAPGQFLARSLIGFTDHHVAEAFLTALTLLAGLRALDADTPHSRLAGATLTGAALSAYLMAWSGGALLVFVLCAWGAVQYVVDDVHRAPTDRVAPVLLPALAIAAVVLLGLQDRHLWRFAVQLTAVAAGLGFVAAMAAARRALRALAAPRGALLACALVVAVGGALVFSIVAPELTGRILSDLQRFRPGHAALTVSEVRPLLRMSGPFSLAVPLGVFGPAFFVSLPALGWLAWQAARTARPGLVLLVVWSTLMYVATLGQNRFGYYLGLTLALLTGWACDRALAWGWAAPHPALSRADGRDAHGRAGARTGRRPTGWPRVAAVAAVVALVFGPSAWIAVPMAGNDLGLSEGYRASLRWLRTYTPEPFADPGYYYVRYRPGHTQTPAYTVMAWWDYGYEIIRVGRRVPVANPTQAGADVAGRFFTATEETEAVGILDRTRARYVIAHAEIPILPRGALQQGKFETLVAWAGKDIRRYWEPVVTRDAQERRGTLTLFHPDYYRALAVRLYLYGGAAATPQDSTYVVTYDGREPPDGTLGRAVLEWRRFRTYEDAVVYLDRVGRAGRALVGIDPTRTPVPIEPLMQLRLVHESAGPRPAVRVFEYLGAR